MRFVQADRWHRGLERGIDAYSPGHCAMCGASVTNDAAKIMLTRTDDGEWWAVAPDAPVRDDERQMGDPHFVLPIGQECLAKHPQFRFALFTSPAPTPTEEPGS